MKFVIIGPIILFGIFMLALVLKNFSDWKNQKALPVTASEGIVVAKRYKAKEFGGNRDHTRSFGNSHFITFQFNFNNERQEFRVRERDFGLIVEGDEGTLWHQGRLFVKFKRKDTTGFTTKSNE